MQKFIIVKTKDSSFITDNVENRPYFSTVIDTLLFEGEKLVPTFKKDWFILPKIPSLIQKHGVDKRVNIRWLLKEGYPVSEKMPAVVYQNPNDEDSNYNEVSMLYYMTFDTEPGSLESVEFEYELIDSEENFYVDKPKYSYTSSLITELSTPNFLRSERPCSITGKDLYTIVRSHVKLNINPKHAKVTSDYDFCFGVSKVLELAVPKPYTNNIGTSKRPRHIKGLTTHQNVLVFETAPAPYQSYTVQEPIHGKNYLDLEQKIDKYLSDIVEIINQPVKQCKCCSGSGVTI